MSRGQSFSLTDAVNTINTRRQPMEIFYNDPFKIQSYNFRYADRPAYPVQSYQRPQYTQSKALTFETYYQNPKFYANHLETKAAIHSSTLTEYRRRNFLHDYKCVPSQPNKVLDLLAPTISAERNPRIQPLLRSCCNRAEYRTVPRGQSVTSLKQTSISTNSAVRRGGGRAGTLARSASFCSVRDPEKNCSTSTFQLLPRRSESTCSGCAININISGLEPEAELDKSLRINIQTDACLQNNTDRCKIAPSFRAALHRSNSFVIDKRLSKFSLHESAAQASCQYVQLKGKRLQMQSEWKPVEQVSQQDTLKDQQSIRLCDRRRDRLTDLERQHRHERLHKLELERARRDERVLEQKKKECYWERSHSDKRQQRLPMRAISMPTSIASPISMTPHLQRRSSTDRLPEMPNSNLTQPRTQAARAERLQSCTRNLTSLQSLKTTTSQSNKRSPSNRLERRSSGSCNDYNASVARSVSSCSVGSLSSSRLDERKLLNLHVNGMPVSTKQPIYTRINNLPIRITTSQSADENLHFSVNSVHICNPSPATRSPVQDRRRGSSTSSTSSTKSTSNSSSSNNNCRSQEQLPKPYSVNIRVYADSR